MPRRNRCYGHGFLHFITFSCYSRLRLLGTARRRDLLLRLLEQTRKSYCFVVVGYVVMPQHVHLLISEPERGDPGTVVQVLKQRFARTVLRKMPSRQVAGQSRLWSDSTGQNHVWQARFYDFVVLDPQQWPWSSYQDTYSITPGPCS